MIGTLVQYILYAMLFTAVAMSVFGFYLTFHARRGRILEAETAMALSGLALLAGVSPYVGLFGTVWHIIQALGGIGGGNLNVAAIAQPIGEALYTTLWGLGTAIISLVAHRVILVAFPEDASAKVERPEA